MAVTEKVLGTVKKLTFAWTSDEDGDAQVAGSEVLDGKLIGLTTIPDGVAAPTDNYDLVLNDADGHDVLLGAGANRDTANTEHVAEASLGAVAHSPLTLVVSNAGDTKEGTVVVYIR